MAARSKARKRALDLLFEADVRGTDAVSTVAERIAAGAGPPLADYALTLIEGVVQQRARIDEVIATYAEGWEISRMPGVDRNVLRIAVWELLWGEVPDGVAINEAVELAKTLSTDDSPRFINGVLGRVALAHPAAAG
ncbi:MAG: transcription antitermination factor NusB [Mycobacteriales bacterium]